MCGSLLALACSAGNGSTGGLGAAGTSNAGATSNGGSSTGGGTSSGGSKTGGTSSGGASSGGTSSGGASSGGASSGGASSGGTSSGGTSNANCTLAGGAGGDLSNYTVTKYNNASWAGCSTGDKIAVNSNGYLAMTTSDCPLDKDMANVKPYVDKIFNGCLDECYGDTNMAGHGVATVFDWTTASGGWAVAEMSSTLHWTGMWPPSTGTGPLMVVFWIRGAVGGEQDRFTVAIHAHASNNNSAAVKVPIAITTAWQRVAIPWDKFKVPANPYPDALTFAATTSGRTTFFVDQAYLSKSVAACP